MTAIQDVKHLVLYDCWDGSSQSKAPYLDKKMEEWVDSLSSLVLFLSISPFLPLFPSIPISMVATFVITFPDFLTATLVHFVSGEIASSFNYLCLFEKKCKYK